MADRARQVQENYEDRQSATQAALADLFAEIEKNEQRKREQAEKGYDAVRYFVFTALKKSGIENAETVSGKVIKAFVDFPSWRESVGDLRELRKAVTFAVYAEKGNLDDVAAIVEGLLATFGEHG